MGNIFVYRGSFQLPGQAAEALYWHGFEKLYTDKPDEAEAEQAFRQSGEMDPTAFFVHIELANLLLKRDAREEALQAYSDALRYAPDDAVIRQPIEEQIRRFSHTAGEKIPPLRNPFLE
jgi:tetratricopeptide (TPR) repeat protein